MNKAVNFIKDEILEVIPAFIYFFITFNVIGFTKVLMLRGYGIRVSTFVHASIGALMAAKVVLIVDLLPFLDPFPETPIVYNVMWKTGIYWVVAVIIQLLDDSVHLLLNHRSLVAVWAQLTQSPFWVIQIWLVMVLFVFCTFNELVRILGAQNVRRIFVGSRSSDKVP